MLDYEEKHPIEIEQSPLYEKKVHTITEKNLHAMLRQVDWETTLQVLGFRITEMFKKAFRKEYISLNEYKNVSLDHQIQPMKDLYFFSFTYRTIHGKNMAGNKIIIFEYKLIDD